MAQASRVAQQFSEFHQETWFVPLYRHLRKFCCLKLAEILQISIPMGSIWSDFPFLSPFSYMLIWLNNILLFYSWKSSHRNRSCISMCSFLDCACNKQGPLSVSAASPVSVCISVTYRTTIHERRWNFTATASNGRWCFICFPCTLW